MMAPAAWSLFLSSTVRDLEEYRREVRDACLHKAETACLLSEEDWSGGYDDTVAKCEERVQIANAFLLILGYWYGSVPPGRDRSITHIEFDGAVTKWRSSKFPPMAVMVPAPGSPADKSLLKAARILLEKEQAGAAQHEKCLGAFRAIVTGSWRTVTPFKNKNDLREHVIARCWQWKGRTPLAAARGEIVEERQAPAASQVTDEQLGALGRERQTRTIKTALAKLADHPDVPAVAFLVFGDDDSGQRVFAQRLTTTALKNYHPRRRIARLPVQCDDPAVLSAWIGRLLGTTDLGGVQTPQELAVRVATELKGQSLFFGLDRMGDLSGGVNGFRDVFWVPFYRELCALRSTQQFTHRLIAIITDYSGDLHGMEPATCAPDDKGDILDYSRLLQVPRLEAFNREEILTWFDDMDIPDAPVGRRAALANRALKDSKGQTDPSPMRVFERLRGEILWPAGDRE